MAVSNDREPKRTHWRSSLSTEFAAADRIAVVRRRGDSEHPKSERSPYYDIDELRLHSMS
jgi:hypothetical protein